MSLSHLYHKMSRNNEQQCELFIKVAQFTRFLADESLSNLFLTDGDDSLSRQVINECDLLVSSLKTLMDKNSRRQEKEIVKCQNKQRNANGNEMSTTPSGQGQKDMIWLNLLTLIDSFGGKAVNSCEIYAYCGLCDITELRIFEWNRHYTSDDHRKRLKQVTLNGIVCRETRCTKCGLVIFCDEELMSCVLNSREHNKVDLKIQVLRESEKGSRNAKEGSDNESQADTTSSIRRDGPKKFSYSNSRRHSQLSHGQSSESLHRSGENKNAAFYFVDNEKIFITAQFEEICKKMLVPNASSFYYCRPCWFCTNDKDEWTAHCLDSPPHSKVMEKHTNYHVVCNLCGLQLIASFKIPEAFIKYHLRVNHSNIKEQNYSGYYKQCQVLRTD